MKTSFTILTFFLLFSMLHKINAQNEDFIQQQVALEDKVFDVYQLPNKGNTVNANDLLAVGDNCNDPISVPVNGGDVQVSLVGATNSGIIPPCANSSTIFDTWIVTQADAGGYLDISFSVPSGAPREYGLTFWKDCTGSNEALTICDRAPVQFGGRLFINGEFSPNQIVYVQIWTPQESTQEIIISSISFCGIFFGSVQLVNNDCNANDNIYSPTLSANYYTDSQNANLEVKDSNFQTIFSTPVTGSPQNITIPNLPADGKNQKYFIGLDVCNSFNNLNLQAPNSDCSISGGGCSDAIPLVLGSFEDVCTNIANAGFSGTTPSCLDESKGAIQDIWYRAQSDDIGSLRFEIYEKNYNIMTIGYSIYDDCQQPQISFCIPPPSFENTFNSFDIPADYRIPNKIWYLQVWAYAEEEQNICVRAAPDCNINKVELGAVSCINGNSFSQEVTLEHFNLPTGSTIRVLNASQNYSLIFETAVTTSPQTINIPNLDANANEIDLSINSSEHSCYGRFLNNIPIPDCANGSTCPADLVITGFPNLGNYQATNTITTNSDTRIFSNTTFKAGTSITLKAGFQVFNNTEFKATIEDCPTTASTLIQSEFALVKPTTPQNQVLAAQNHLNVYPNPFSNSTTIEYQIKKPGQAEILLFDISGKQLKQIDSGYKEKGTYQASLSANNLESGLYFVYANLEGAITVKKVYLVK
ncbi:MAG: 3-coathanger stack domain-containing protein [Saprospiraceae bacterium]